MIGNAVPVEFARNLAQVIYFDISDYLLSLQKEGNTKMNIFSQEEKVLVEV
jgi:hypothetical protein